MKEKDFWNSIYGKNLSYSKYGNSVNLSIGLIIGVLIDKLLFILTKGLSVIIPPFGVMLMSKGKVLHTFRFEQPKNKVIKYILNHFITK